ncbi:Uncharacterized protein dnm_008180 [Desulfonema magnum]|uniref:Uncharacterized protein n=1 Tax=Desulfonema magnum TaxID=45655 RepID=A0A975BG10_9BACT|nr:Uncharacterized protein dnm_008180 [Desulfonema magnum]
MLKLSCHMTPSSPDVIPGKTEPGFTGPGYGVVKLRGRAVTTDGLAVYFGLKLGLYRFFQGQKV